MFDFIKSTYNKGDKLKLTCGNGEFSGEILFINNDSIILKTMEGKTCGIKGNEISFFEELSVCTSKPLESVNPKNNEQDQIVENIFCDDATTEQSDKEFMSSQEMQEKTKLEKSKEQHDGIHKEVNVTQYKVGDVIPLDVLHQIDPRTAKPKIIKTAKTTQTFNGLDSLRVLVEGEHKIQNEKIVPALGEIKFAKPENNFGFIIDGRTGKKLYFSFSQIVDKGINKSSNSMYRMPVIYSIQANDRGDMAITIHRPNTVGQLIDLAKELISQNNIKHASRVLDHILAEYPDNFSADELKRNIEKSYPKIKSYSTLYNLAKKYSLEKNYPQAIEYFVKAIGAREKLESSIKDLGMLYVQLFKQGGENAFKYKKSVISLINEHKDDLPDTISTLYYLENLYYSIQDYERFIGIAKDLLARNGVKQDRNRSSQLRCKMAVAYVQSEEIDKALETIEESLLDDSNNVWAIKLKTAIESNESKAEIIEAISATQFDSLTSGLSSFIQQTLDDYKEYAGVPAKVKEAGNFNDTTLKGVRGIIEKFSGRSKDRAPYLLTEAKLMQEIEPENTLRLRTILARYCNDMAKTHIADNSSLDVIRFFYNEAFSLEENYDNNAQNVAYFILTHVYDYRELLQVTTRDVSVDFALKKTIANDFDIKQWINILSMFLYNRVISAKLTSIFYSNIDYKTKAIEALNKLGISINICPSKEEFTDAWNNARETLKRYNSNIVASIRTITNSSSLEDICQQLLSLNDLRKEWMCALDINRIYTIVNNIVPTLSSYLKSSGFRYKESNRNLANGQISQLIEEIKNEPTKLSYEEFLPLLDSIGTLLANSFNEVIRMSEPRINIHLLSERTVINDNGIVNIQIEVVNHKDSSPIKEVSISIDERKDLKLVNGGEVLYNAIEGGESHIFKLQFEVSEEVINQKATAATICCNYRNGNDVKQTSNQLSLKLYSQEEFTPIENPYAPNADGGPLKWDSKMFFGREEEIKNIVNAIINSPSKQIIIYGQKRSGKSSVLNRIQHNLLDTGNIFCVSFSLGEITQNLNEVSFYYKIIHSIKQELDLLELDGINNIPKFEIPSAREFKEEDEDNPLNTFTKYMIKYKLSCKQTNGWKDKRLVIMIDEFTYLYTEIKKGNISSSIMKQWKAITQNERAQFSVVLVGQDIVPSFKKEDYARNAFGVIQDMRLTYLKDKPARELIETPILDENGHSRYIGEAVSRIIDYTSRNPYYIQIFCSRLVDYMNTNKSICVTEADVNEVARSFVYGSDALEEDKFDNLIRAGESEDLQEHSETDIMAVLRQIAINSKNIGYCNRNNINVLGDIDKENAILKDLYDREVLEMKGENNYKIQVKLFQEWLLNH